MHRAGPSRVEGIRAEAPLFGFLVFVYKVEVVGSVDDAATCFVGDKDA